MSWASSPRTCPPRRGRPAPTRWLVAALGSIARAGRLTLARWVVCLVVLGSVDLDLRLATLTGGSVTIVVIGVPGSVDVYSREGLNAEVRALSILGHADANGNDLGQPGSPLVRLVSLSALTGIDIWRVPSSTGQRSWRKVLKASRRGEHLLPPGD